MSVPLFLRFQPDNDSSLVPFPCAIAAVAQVQEKSPVAIYASLVGYAPSTFLNAAAKADRFPNDYYKKRKKVLWPEELPIIIPLAG